MNIAFLSDLHFEFHADHGHSFVRSLDTTGVDVLVLAGDIAVGKQIGQALSLFCQHYKYAQIVYVQGNHEHYDCPRGPLDHALERAQEKHPQLCVLRTGTQWSIADHCSTIAAPVPGVTKRMFRFLGDTMWFRNDPTAAHWRSSMNDFLVIPRFTEWVFEENARFLDFLARELREGDIVVTHHLPVRASIPARFTDSPLNAFFFCDVEALIQERKPALWIHGHTHDSVDVMVGQTRIVCNPFGYVGHELNPNFDENRRVIL